MKTYQYLYKDSETFDNEMKALAGELQGFSHDKLLFHIFAECWCESEARAIREITEKQFPGSLLVGTASFGNIRDGRCERFNIVVTAMVFEDPRSQVEAFLVYLDEAHADESLCSFAREVEARPWVKGVEAYVMGSVPMVTKCCEVLVDLPEQVEFFGGKSRFDHSETAPKFVIDNEGRVLGNAAAFVLYGGETIHLKTAMIQGWKPLGRPMKATRYEGDLLYELDGQPAYELYNKYLNIKNDENYFFNTLEFPFLFYKGDSSQIRISHVCLDDGTMVLGATIPEHDYLRIAFGDANEILRSVCEGGKEFEAFRPDGILLFPCGCRRTYWGDEQSNQETAPFESLAPTSGFYTGGELLRMNGELNEHNSTLVVAAIREGDAADKPPVTFGMRMEDIAHEDSLTLRLSTFIRAAIDELNEANHRLELLSITDGLTGLFNRREEERLIREAVADPKQDRDRLCLIMLDIDNFKHVNDTYGHSKGDMILENLSAVLTEQAEPLKPDIQVGRWGGEEFIILLTDADEAKAAALAEQIRAAFAQRALGLPEGQSVSIGVSRLKAGETADALISRVDAAMYKAKGQGKNRVIAL